MSISLSADYYKSDVAWPVWLSWASSRKAKGDWGQGTCLGCSFGLLSGRWREATDQCFSLTWMFLSLSFLLSSPLSEIYIHNIYINTYFIYIYIYISIHVTYLPKHDIHEIVNEQIIARQWFTLMPSFNYGRKTASKIIISSILILSFYNWGSKANFF